MAAGLHISSALVAAAMLPGLAQVTTPIMLDSCTKQDSCIDWTVRPASDACQLASPAPADYVANWQVCMTINKGGVGKPSCPKLMVRSTCPKAGCPGNFTASNGCCGAPALLPHTECQYGKPGETLRFFVQDGDSCADSTLNNTLSTMQAPSGGGQCVATKRCGQKPVGVASCWTDVLARECVHEVTLPANCGVKPTIAPTVTPTIAPTGKPTIVPTVKPSMAPGAIESMPAKIIDPLGKLGLSAGAAPAALSSSAMALAGAVGVAVAAFVGALTYRRLSAPTTYEARALEESLAE